MSKNGICYIVIIYICIRSLLIIKFYHLFIIIYKIFFIIYLYKYVLHLQKIFELIGKIVDKLLFLNNF